MRSLLVVLLATLSAFALDAQQISGTVKDAEGKPLNGATVTLLKDTAVVKLAVTKESGVYTFDAIKEGTYKVSFSYVGHAPSVSAPFTVSSADVKVPEMQLAKAAANMQGVTVTARKPPVEVKADKMIVNVEGTVNAVGSDALDLLRKSPGVMVDKDDNLSVSGKNGVQVYIDGRPSPLSGADLANYLKTLQSAQIEAIEIITNPSAKYEAAGNAGIINIRLKKNKNFGTNGSVNAGYNVGVYAKYNGGFSLNYRNNNINIYGNYNYSHGLNDNNFTLNRVTADTLFDQRSSMTFANRSHNFKAGADYTINKQSSIGAIINGNIGDPVFYNQSRTPIAYNPTGVVDRILIADNRTDMKRNTLNYNLNYNYTGKNGKTLTLNVDHGTNNLNNDQMQPNNYYSPSGAYLYQRVYQMITPTDINISSFKADYEQNFAKGKLGLGTKISYVNTDNNFQRYDVVSGVKSLDKDRSNRFRYEENINAGYINYNRALKGINIQVGLRVENTVSEGRSNGMKHNGSNYIDTAWAFKRPYTDFFPSAAITFNKNPMKQWNFTYSRRIDRPFYQDLNPFEMKLDEYTYMKGNINLRPQYTNSFGVTHTYKYKLNITANYSHVADMFLQLPRITEGTKGFLMKENLAKQDIVSLNVSYPFMYKNFMSFMNLNSFYSMYEASFGPGEEIDANAFGLNFFSQNTLKFGKTKAWTAELSGFYNAPTLYQGAFKMKGMFGIDAGMQKNIMKGKGTVKASVSDVFRTLQFRGTVDFAGQHSKVQGRWESQQFKLSFNFRFGNSQVKAAKQRSGGAEDENKRIGQGGGGGIGIGN
jgi:iron complex outermembrane recepter protein